MGLVHRAVCLFTPQLSLADHHCGCAPSPEKFFANFYIKMVNCGAFWVAISYRLAACFTGIGSTVRVELKFIGDRSGILGTIITP